MTTATPSRIRVTVALDGDGHLAMRCARGYVEAGEKLYGLATDRPA